MAAIAAAYDEVYCDDGRPRAHYDEVLAAIGRQGPRALRDRMREQVVSRGVSFAGAGGPPFAIDPVPRVIAADEWSRLGAGLAQRVRALNLFAADVYAERRIVEAGVVPEAVILTSELHAPEMRGVPLPACGPLAVVGLDIVRDEYGRFLVLEDNVRTPSGIAYAAAAREVLDACLEPMEGRLPLDDIFDLLAAALRSAALTDDGDPFTVVLSDGPGSSAWYEHQTIAARLALPLVTLDDLRVDSRGLHARVPGGERRVDVLYRRTSDDRLVDAGGRRTPTGELLLDPCRRGQLACVNAFGGGVADDKLTHAYVEDMVRFYLGEEPLIRSIPTYDLGAENTREGLLDRIDELVVKPRAESGGNGVFVGPHASADECARVAAAVRARPREFIAQETVSLSQHATIVGSRLEPRHVDLRAFVMVSDDGVTVVPGGLTRVALRRGSLIVNSSQEGGGKDTWVLSR